MNSVNCNLNELNQYFFKPFAVLFKWFIDWLLISFFVFNLVALVTIVLFFEVAAILVLLEKLTWIKSSSQLLHQPFTYLVLTSVSVLAISYSLYHVKTTKQSLLGWLNSHRIKQFFISESSPKKEQPVRDDHYWSNFYFQRAEKFRYGNGVEANMEYAIKLYQAAAKLENTQAQVSLSYLLMVHYNPKDKQADMNEAHNWALKATQKNEPGAWFNLGHMYKHGLGTSVNLSKSLHAFEQAVYHGFYNMEQSGAAFYELGILYLEGKEIGKNLSKAIKWLSKAVAANYANADKVLEKAYREERESPKNNASNQKKNHHNKSNKDSSTSGKHKSGNKNNKTEFNNNGHFHSQKQSKQQSPQKMACPACDKELLVPNPVPKGDAVCVKCRQRFRIKSDHFGNLQVLLVTPSVPNNFSLPKNEKEAREVLSLLTDSGATMIRQAYKAKMRDYHPDKVNNLGKKIKNLAELESKRINRAYELLKKTG